MYTARSRKQRTRRASPPTRCGTFWLELGTAQNCTLTRAFPILLGLSFSIRCLLCSATYKSYCTVYITLESRLYLLVE